MIHDLFQSTMYMYFSKQKYVIFCMIKWETIVILKENLPYRPSFTTCTYILLNSGKGKQTTG